MNMFYTTKEEQSNEDKMNKTYKFLEQETLLITEHEAYIENGVDVGGGNLIQAKTPKEYEQYITLPHIQALCGNNLFERVLEKDYDSKLNIGDYIFLSECMIERIKNTDNTYDDEIRKQIYEIIKITNKRIYVRHLHTQDIVYYFDGDRNINTAIGRITKGLYCCDCNKLPVITKNHYSALTKINIDNHYIYMYDLLDGWSEYDRHKYMENLKNNETKSETD